MKSWVTAATYDEAGALKATAKARPESESTLADQENTQALNLLRSLGLRYFTEHEVARLMGFPVSEGKFSFPETTSLKQRYRVLGNSINVKVVAELIKYLLTPNPGFEKREQVAKEDATKEEAAKGIEDK
ncbi:Sphingolipid C9-methyltransferase 2 [Linnemannia zychae]|nr:Sphingolipid C9-methyltransferase 2 [Linnemannia zychae]